VSRVLLSHPGRDQCLVSTGQVKEEINKAEPKELLKD